MISLAAHRSDERDVRWLDNMHAMGWLVVVMTLLAVKTWGWIVMAAVLVCIAPVAFIHTPSRDVHESCLGLRLEQVHASMRLHAHRKMLLTHLAICLRRLVHTRWWG
jgi:hypothetical protein